MKEYIEKSAAIHAVLHNEGQAAVAAVQEIEAVDTIYGYPITDLLCFAMTCRNYNVRNEDLETFANNMEAAMEIVQKEQAEQMQRFLDEYYYKIEYLGDE